MSFSELFASRIDAVEKSAVAAGLSMTDVCREAGMAKINVDRWRKEVPKTIELLDRLEAAAEVAIKGKK